MPHGERAEKYGRSGCYHGRIRYHGPTWFRDPRYKVRTVVVTVEPAPEPEPEPYPFQRIGLLFWRI